MELIDTHLHMIHRDRFTYEWTGNVPVLATGDYTLADAKALAGGRIKGFVFMEVDVAEGQYRDEARFVHSLMTPGSGLLGQIVACRPECDEGFDDWVEEACELGTVGFRRILHETTDDVSQPEVFRANVRKIGAAGQVFDMNFLARQLPLAKALAEACPDQQLVLDHCGVPDIAGDGFDLWRRNLLEVAALPHVACKLSGIMAYCGPDKDPASAIGPYVDQVLEAFSPDRVVWGSDWPVVNLGGGLPAWLDATEAILSKLSPDEQAAIGHKNAQRVYALPG